MRCHEIVLAFRLMVVVGRAGCVTRATDRLGDPGSNGREVMLAWEREILLGPLDATGLVVAVCSL